MDEDSTDYDNTDDDNSQLELPDNFIITGIYKYLNVNNYNYVKNEVINYNYVDDFVDVINPAKRQQQC